MDGVAGDMATEVAPTTLRITDKGGHQGGDLGQCNPARTSRQTSLDSPAQGHHFLVTPSLFPGPLSRIFESVLK